MRFFRHAVSLWGNKGAVRSLLIVGIEPTNNTLKGVRELSSIGVMPILSAFRPIPKTPMSEYPSPTPETIYEVFKAAQQICQQNQVPLGPSCIACQNNTITLPFGDVYQYY